MSTPSMFVSDRSFETSAVSAPRRTPHPFLWSVRLELWRSRWIVLGPLMAAFMLVAGYLGNLVGPSRLAELVAAGRHDAIGHPYALALAMISLGALPMGLLYSLLALRGERRDRSILFWKSLPVSDATAVLSKAAVVFVVLPLVVFAVTMAVHAAFLVIGTTAVILAGGNALPLWRDLLTLDRIAVIVYGIGTLALQHAPLYAWLLLVSAWAPRLSALWALLPPYFIVMAERTLFGHSRLEAWLRDVVIGGFARSFAMDFGRDTMGVADRISDLDVAAFFGHPGAWFGLVLAAVFLGLAVVARREREPA